MLLEPALQDNVLLPEWFTKYINNVGNANEFKSIIRNVLVPGGTSGLLHCSESDGRRLRHGKDSMRSDEIKYKKTWKRPQNAVCWNNLKLAQEKSLQFYQSRSHAVVLYNTPLAACIEKAVCMKTQDDLHQKVRLTPRVPRFVLKSHSQYGPQDPQSQEARSSWEPSSDSKSYGEICNNTGLQNIWSTSFCSRAARHNTREQGQEVDREVREPHT